MKVLKKICLYLLLFFPAYVLADMNQCLKLEWQDDFVGNRLDENKWNIELGDGCDQQLCGWGNNELQWYSKDNIEISDSILTINAIKNSSKDKLYTSSKLSTKSKFFQKFGRFEARMKLPSMRGAWPAFWMMPETKKHPWPVEGEIDILEQAGRETDDAKRILGAIHFGRPWPDNVHYSESLLMPFNWGDEFHNYRVDWYPGRIVWSVDDKVYGDISAQEITPHQWPFDSHPFYLILNLAVGGTLGGDVPDDFNAASLYVDYVRVYRYCDE